MVLRQGVLTHCHQICYFSMLMSRSEISLDMPTLHSATGPALAVLFCVQWIYFVVFSAESVVAPKTVLKMLFSLLVLPT